jgi:hypothetical protein
LVLPLTSASIRYRAGPYVSGDQYSIAHASQRNLREKERERQKNDEGHMRAGATMKAPINDV